MKRPTLFSLAAVALSLALGSSAVAQTVVATIPVGSSPDWVAVDRKTDLIYAVNAGSNNVSVIDGSTNTVVGTDAVSNFPQAAAVNPILDQIYVGAFGSKDQLSVIAGKTNRVVSIPISNSGVVTGIAADTANNSLYMCNPSNNVVALHETKGHVTSTTINVPNCGFGMAVNATADLIYVGTFTPNVTVIDGSSNTIVNTFSIDLTGVVSVAIDASSNHLAIVDTNAGQLEVLDADTGARLGTVSGLQKPFGLVLVPGAKFALVTEESGNDMAVVDTVNYTIVNRTPVGTFPLAMDFNPLTKLAYVANSNSNSVTVISLP
jgi:YVTN family beta-propeller protein